MVKRSVPLSTHKPVVTPPSAIPTSVAKAMQAELGLEITGYLSSVEYGPGERFLRGVVFGDREKRFDDGELIRTSIIMTSQMIQGFNSLYVVCDWAGDGARGCSKALH
ncbi:hypothetical protein N5D52_18520 [Pseudomonas sp. GD03860]|nr:MULTISPECIES: hypothetical protein [Pseudomonas]MDD2059116.1 hypothetical protein [Pseudomonas putida]MDH0638938.1 hypothetical protein [Pseudomonas sp. GD03860]